MSDDLQRLKALRNLPHEALDTEEDDVAGVFGWLRGASERSVMLELRLNTGNSKAFSFAYLENAEYDPSTGITLQFGATTVQLLGRKLNAEVRPNVKLFEGLLRHRITWIQESGQAESLASHAAVVVSGIRVS